MSLHDELARARAERDRLDVVIDYLERRLQVSQPGATTSLNGRRPTAAQAAENVLAAHGEPMRTPDLLRAVQQAGAQIKDADGLYKTLSRNSKFVRAGRGLWTLAS